MRKMASKVKKIKEGLVINESPRVSDVVNTPIVPVVEESLKPMFSIPQGIGETPRYIAEYL